VKQEMSRKKRLVLFFGMAALLVGAIIFGSVNAQTPASDVTTSPSDGSGQGSNPGTSASGTPEVSTAPEADPGTVPPGGPAPTAAPAPNSTALPADSELDASFLELYSLSLATVSYAVGVEPDSTPDSIIELFGGTLSSNAENQIHSIIGKYDFAAIKATDYHRYVDVRRQEVSVDRTGLSDSQIAMRAFVNSYEFRGAEAPTLLGTDVWKIVLDNSTGSWMVASVAVEG